MADKTYYDLTADTENTWDLEENLEELLFDSEAMLAEAMNKSYLQPIKKGDIIMANNGVSDRELGLSIQSPHRIFIIEDAIGEIGSRVFRGYLLSSQVRKANYYNERFPNNIYINDYSTILARGPQRNAEVFLNLADCYTIDERLMDIESGGFWKGHATQEFIDFIDKVIAEIKEGKSAGRTYWIK